MCGRFTLRASASVIAEQFALFERPPFAARYNIAPTQTVPVIRLRPGGEYREMAWLRWGLIPTWAKEAGIGNRLINARGETAAVKPAFREAFQRRRCLVVADGFYEWRRAGRTKQPYFFRLCDDRPFAFAGLWEAWEGPDHAAIESCTLLTTVANELVRTIHDRMPVILPPESHSLWLNPAIDDPARLAPLLMPYAAGAMAATPVGAFVNDPTHEGPRCIEPPARLFE
jgi:putative SOS response-associated peptidase YedK